MRTLLVLLSILIVMGKIEEGLYRELRKMDDDEFGRTLIDAL
jgi:hypothetical protein